MSSMELNLNRYIDQALRSEQPKEALVGDPALTATTIELLVAAGELGDLLKKQLIYGKPVPQHDYMRAIDLVQDTLDTVRATAEDGVKYDQLVLLPPRFTHAALGIFGEAGELLEALLDASDGEAELDVVNVGEELGDCLWYLGLGLRQLEDTADITPDDVAEANIAKLRKRFPDKFSLEASEGRDTGAERQVLEAAL